MRFCFSDITLYAPTSYEVGTPEYWEEISLQNFVSDLYVQKMNGYKPPNTTRITIQPAYYDIWKRTWKNGSIVAIASYYDQNKFATLDKKEKYKYILEIIQSATISLSDEYGWDRTVFENAYKTVIESDFRFEINYPSKLSRDKSKTAFLSILKTEAITSVFANIQTGDSILTKKLFDKNNEWWYDDAYLLARHNKWFDNDRFGIDYKKRSQKIWYSIQQNEVFILDNGQLITEKDLRKYFLLG